MEHINSIKEEYVGKIKNNDLVSQNCNQKYYNEGHKKSRSCMKLFTVIKPLINKQIGQSIKM